MNSVVTGAVFVLIFCQKGFTQPVPEECYGESHFLPSTNRSNLDPHRSPYNNVTLWIVFNSTTFGGISPFEWTYCPVPNSNLPGQLQHIGGVMYNASLQVNLTSPVDFGRYVVKVNNKLLETFVVTRNNPCFHQTVQLRNITSPAVVPSLPGRNITVSCYLSGNAHDPSLVVKWKNSKKKEFNSHFFQNNKSNDTACTFYYQLEIVNATSELSDNYTCDISQNSNPFLSMKTELSIIDLPRFIHYPRTCQYRVTDPVSLTYVIRGERVYVNPKLTINGTEQLDKYCQSLSHCNVTIAENQGLLQLSLNIAERTLQPASYIVKVCAYLNSETVSKSYAEEYNTDPICKELTLIVQNGENNQWTISTAAGAGVLLLLIIVTLAITGVTCYRKWKRRNGYIIIPGENVEQPVLEPQFDSLERDGPVKARGKVLIVYYEDSPDTESQIEGLCDILNKLSKECVCDCDIVHRTEPGIDWNNWTQRKIQEANFVLLVCSKQLYDCLSQAKNSPLIRTAVAMISGAAIANLCSMTDSSKFIPIFLNQDVDHDIVPNCLKSRKVYKLITTGLMDIPSDGVPADVFHRAIQEYFNQNFSETKDVIDLVECLKQLRQ